MQLIRGRLDQPSGAPEANFTGTVYSDRLIEVPGTLRALNVFFSPGARTYWHSHGNGQVLKVVGGEGLVGNEGEGAQVIRAGDLVWTPPGEMHWHGAGGQTYLMHTAISLGETQWAHEVSAQEYGQ